MSDNHTTADVVAGCFTILALVLVFVFVAILVIGAAVRIAF